MTESPRTRHALCVAAVVVLSILSPVATGAVGAAEPVDSTASVTVSNAAEGERTAHEWNVTVGSADRTLQELRLTYAGTGSNLSNAYTFRAAVRIDGSSVDVDAVSSDRDSLRITLADGRRIDGGETISVTAYGVENPSRAGAYDATFELRNDSAAFVETSDSFEVVRGGNVTGTVTDTAGSALSDASVIVANASTGHIASRTATNSDGEYAASVPAGTYTVDVTAVDYEAESQTVTEYETASRTVSVTADSETATDVSLRTYGAVNGTITDIDGAVGSAGVFVVPHGGPFGAVATTDASGDYSATVPPGDYDVVIDSSDRMESVDGVRINGDGSTIVDLQLLDFSKTGVINGTIVDQTGAPISGATVRAGDRYSRVHNGTVTGDNGEFSLTVPAVTYRVEASATGFANGRLRDVTVSENETTNVRVQLDSLARSSEERGDSGSAVGDTGGGDAASGSHRSRAATPAPTTEAAPIAESTLTADPTPTPDVTPTAPSTSTADRTPTAASTPTDTSEPTVTTSESVTTAQETPGFGIMIGVVAVIAASMLVRRRHGT